MEFQTEEQRRWRELTAELRRDWRLVAHLARFDAAVRLRRNLATARDGSAVPAVTWMPALLGAFVGLVARLKSRMTVPPAYSIPN
jgi:hypothetical protein